MAEQLAMLVDRTALDGQVLAPERDKCGLKTRGAVDDDERGLLQPTRIKIGEKLAPGRLALSTHIHDG